MMPILLLFFLLVPALPASTNGCEAQPEVRQALDTIERHTQELKYAEAMAYSRKAFEELLVKYPRDIAVHRKYVEFIKRGTPDAMPALRAKYQQEAERSPQDAFAVYMAGSALQQFKTPESLRLVEKAKTLDPGIPWTYITLASLYGGGKFADKAKASENMAAFYRVCPASLEELPLQMIGSRLPPEAQREIAKAVRARLEKETDPARLRLFSELWGAEFRTTPISEHPALRKQVAADIQRLESLNPKPDAEWLDFLKGGIQQSGAPKEAVTAVEDRISREFPSSSQAEWIVRRRWRTEHPEPKPDASIEEWASFRKTYLAAIDGWMRQFPQDEVVWRNMMLPVLPVSGSIQRKAAVEMGERLLKSAAPAYGPSDAYIKAGVADFYLREKIEPKRALALLRAAETRLAQERARWLENDRLTEAGIANMKKYAAWGRMDMRSKLLRACLQLKNVEEARKLKSDIAGPVPQDRIEASQHWECQALFADVEGRKADALAYYQRALHMRSILPPKRFGRADDPLLDEVRALWCGLGGTEAAWAF